MRIIDCEQQSEAWERWRNRPTASEFHNFIVFRLGGKSGQEQGTAFLPAPAAQGPDGEKTGLPVRLGENDFRGSRFKDHSMELQGNNDILT